MESAMMFLVSVGRVNVESFDRSFVEIFKGVYCKIIDSHLKVQMRFFCYLDHCAFANCCDKLSCTDAYALCNTLGERFG